MLHTITVGTALLALTLAVASAQEPPKSASIRRLNGSTITTAEAEAFARKTLEAAHVTGAQIVVFDQDERFHAETRRFPARAAGSMTTSAEDLGRFVCALLAGKILKPASRKAMLTPAIRIRSLHQFPLQPNEPEGTLT